MIIPVRNFGAAVAVFKRAHISVLLLLVLCARSLLPSGFMVQAATASDALFEVVICTSAGLKVLSHDDGDTPLPAKPQHVDSGLCAFAAAGTLAVAIDATPSLERTADYAAVTFILAAAQFAETPKPGATSARGPPFSLI